MNVIMVWAWLLCSPDVVEYAIMNAIMERYHALGMDTPSHSGMDALVIGRR